MSNAFSEFIEIIICITIQYSDWFLHVEVILHSWDKYQLVTLYNHFYIMLDLEEFWWGLLCLYSWFILVCSFTFLWCLCQVLLSGNWSQNELGCVLLSSIFWKTEKDWFKFFFKLFQNSPVKLSSLGFLFVNFWLLI